MRRKKLTFLRDQEMQNGLDVDRFLNSFRNHAYMINEEGGWSGVKTLHFITISRLQHQLCKLI